MTEEARLCEIATEGWDWLAVALDAGGWATVFDIPDWKERSARLARDDPEYAGRTQQEAAEAEQTTSRLREALREASEALDAAGCQVAASDAHQAATHQEDE